MGAYFQSLVQFVRQTEAEIHTLASHAGKAAPSGVGAGAGGRSESKLPEGIVPRVDHAVAVRPRDAAVGKDRVAWCNANQRDYVSHNCGYGVCCMRLSGNFGSRLHAHLEVCHGIHQHQVGHAVVLSLF